MKRVLFCLAILSLVWGGSALAQPQPITIGHFADAVSLDPHKTNDQPSNRVMRQIYDTLVVQTEELELTPGLAESWKQIDDTTWEFTLRQGVTFHNGQPLTASDVVFTFNRMLDPEVAAPAAFLLGFVESIEAVNDYTVRVVTRFPFAPILAHFSHTTTGILSEQAVTEAGEDYGTTVAIGTGPFRFVRWDPATQIVLERNEDWWGGEVMPARIVFRPIVEGTVRAIELETGGIDITYILEPSDATRMMEGQVSNVRVETVQTFGTNYIGFNMQRAPFDNQLVRQAISYAIDAELIIEAALAGQALPATSPIPTRAFGAHPDLQLYEYDPERARELLAEAGYGDGFNTTLWINDDPIRIQTAEIVQAMLADLNINVDVQVLEWGTFLADTAAGRHDMFILSWNTVTGDADYGLYSLFHSEQMGSPGNRTFYANEQVDELLDRGRTSTDEQERLDAYHEVQEIIVEDAPWVFLYFTIENTGLRANVEGFTPHPTGHHRLYTVSIAN